MNIFCQVTNSGPLISVFSILKNPITLNFPEALTWVQCKLRKDISGISLLKLEYNKKFRLRRFNGAS